MSKDYFTPEDRQDWNKYFEACQVEDYIKWQKLDQERKQRKRALVVWALVLLGYSLALWLHIRG